MPKVPGREMGKYFDPDSEEYSPTKGDIDAEAEAVDVINRELDWIEDQLGHPKRDMYTGEENKFQAIDPEQFWDQLAYLKHDHFDKIKDKKLRKQTKENFLRLEGQVYKQFIPFIEARINFFGWQNSPLEHEREHSSFRKLDSSEIFEYFARARAELKRFELPKEREVDYLSDLNRLEQKLDRYRSEPTLFTFENIEEDLQRELFAFEYGDFYHGRGQESARGLDDAGTAKENALKFDLWAAKAHSLQEIADRMLHTNIATSCKTRAKALLGRVDYFRAATEAPRELSAIEGELKDLRQRIKNNEQVETGRLESLSAKLAALKARRLDFGTQKIIDALIKTIEKLKLVLAGEGVDEEDDRFSVDESSADWAWTVLGIDKNSSQEDLKKSYHSLALKYHPDFNSAKDAEEKMKKINEAVDFIRRVRGYK